MTDELDQIIDEYIEVEPWKQLIKAKLIAWRDAEITKLVHDLANGGISRLKRKYQFNHAGRQALEMLAEDIKVHLQEKLAKR